MCVEITPLRPKLHLSSFPSPAHVPLFLLPTWNSRAVWTELSLSPYRQPLTPCPAVRKVCRGDGQALHFSTHLSFEEEEVKKHKKKEGDLFTCEAARTICFDLTWTQDNLQTYMEPNSIQLETNKYQTKKIKQMNQFVKHSRWKS